MSEKKLYQVDIEVTIDMVVAAESEAEARRIAERDYKKVLDDVAYPDVHASAVDGPLTKCPSDWDGCLPYNSDDERTVNQWFEGETPAVFTLVRPLGQRRSSSVCESKEKLKP